MGSSMDKMGVGLVTGEAWWILASMGQGSGKRAAFVLGCCCATGCRDQYWVWSRLHKCTRLYLQSLQISLTSQGRPVTNIAQTQSGDD